MFFASSRRAGALDAPSTAYDFLEDSIPAAGEGQRTRGRGITGSVWGSSRSGSCSCSGPVV
eukprot:5973261-Prymnesium_polylepis.3